MPDVTQSPQSFYTTPQGLASVSQVADAMVRIWPGLGGLSVLGVGNAAPYLFRLGDSGTRRIAAWTAWDANTDMPPACPVPACIADECGLPFQDGEFDRLVLVHALGARANPLPVLREASRVMKDDGRLLLVIPSRLAGRARLRKTPFGADAAFTRGGVRQVLAAAMLRPERWDEALFLPVRPGAGAGRGGVLPSLMARLGGGSSTHRRLSVDRIGRIVCPGAGSLILVEAVRDVYFAQPVTSGRRGRRWFSRVVLPAAGTARQGAQDDLAHGPRRLGPTRLGLERHGLAQHGAEQIAMNPHA
ncbi:class I SAM-dependent methyltransferase [Acetobacter sp. TBRC 12305]|uniref:Methyltransferase domain-containing protein n=1 Tax=Acetobacter garciniae TaxID=2817435 RepID=A0A939KPC9_9PROT|nr:methyltransferase domain-containing protein [Acetobacter garciniae]MBO1323784.1 methyltransferase domain-containing protein [Acetobacter garciniae]MBX0343473.1 class I SAM-dependent methyltransferase [Acetobacter garciniae]